MMMKMKKLALTLMSLLVIGGGCQAISEGETKYVGKKIKRKSTVQKPYSAEENAQLVALRQDLISATTKATNALLEANPGRTIAPTELNNDPDYFAAVKALRDYQISLDKKYSSNND